MGVLVRVAEVAAAFCAAPVAPLAVEFHCSTIVRGTPWALEYMWPRLLQPSALPPVARLAVEFHCPNIVPGHPTAGYVHGPEVGAASPKASTSVLIPRA